MDVLVSTGFSESCQLIWGIDWGLLQKTEIEHSENQGGRDT